MPPLRLCCEVFRRASCFVLSFCLSLQGRNFLSLRNETDLFLGNLLQSELFLVLVFEAFDLNMIYGNFKNCLPLGVVLLVVFCDDSSLLCWLHAMSLCLALFLGNLPTAVE